jgi:PAS domain S-box-containing protein
MNNQKANTFRENAFVLQIVTGGFIIGLLLGIFFIFSIASTITEVPDELSKFKYMHQQFPSIYLAWLLPVLFSATGYYFANMFIQRKKQYEQILDEKNTIITNNALFAKSIGEGDFDNTTFGALNKQDLLTRSLYLMRENLIRNKEIEQRNIWINEGKEHISIELRKNTDLESLSFNVLKELVDFCGLIQGRFYIWNSEESTLNLSAAYAYKRKKYINQVFKIGEGLIGQAAFERQSIYRVEIPAEYVSITSGILGDKKPGSLFIMPLISEQQIQGVIEVANIQDHIPSKVIELIEQLGPIIGQVLFSVSVNEKTEKLLEEAQILTEELRENEEELHQSAEEMRMTHEELAKSNEELELQIQEVEASKTRLHSLLQNASEIISIYDDRGRIKYISPSVEQILGFSPTEMLGKSSINKIHKEYVGKVKESFIELYNNPQKTLSYTFKHLKKDGSEVYVETTGRNMLDNPAIGGLIFNTRDISIQRIAEKDRRLKSQMQALSENSPDLIIRFSKKGKFHYCNPKVQEYLGYSPTELQGKNIDEVDISANLVEFLHERIDSTIERLRKLEIEFTIKTLEKEKILKVSSIPEYNDEKELETILVVAHDLTEIKAIEKEIIEKNNKLTESINYAQRIQTAILPKPSILNKKFADSFVYYVPRDVVSGDFPWYKETQHGIYLAAVDCTGHGVPGALLSFIGYFLLNNIVSINTTAKAAEILELFDHQVKATLQQDNGNVSTRDGMDIAFCQFSPDLSKLYYAGAHRPLYVVRNGELMHFSGDRRAIGGVMSKKRSKEFSLHEIDLQKGDRIFIFSDGLTDQFKEGSLDKFKENQIRECVQNYSTTPMKELHEHLATKLNNWKGSYRQIDDILLIGVEI